MNTSLVPLYKHENPNLLTFLLDIFLKNLLNFKYLKNDRYQAILGIYPVVIALNPNQFVARCDCLSAFQYIVFYRYTYFAMSENGDLCQAIKK